MTYDNGESGSATIDVSPARLDNFLPYLYGNDCARHGACRPLQ
ncbi:hypothetical protein [Limimaricola soesokkakensis]|nr:hypothetical protein [Limimaricola soesokkakensis]